MHIKRRLVLWSNPIGETAVAMAIHTGHDLDRDGERNGASQPPLIELAMDLSMSFVNRGGHRHNFSINARSSHQGSHNSGCRIG